jgi:hypothetical protein
VAAGITQAGQRNVKAVAEFVISRGFTVRYGDTDSLYLTCPEHYYTDIRAKYVPLIAKLPTVQERGDVRVQYWSELVNITMVVMKNINDDVRRWLFNDNGTCYISMSYEEVGLPTMLCGKKKYGMRAHLTVPNFNEDAEPFVRGIEYIKQGKTLMIKQIGLQFLKKLLSPYNEQSIMDIVNEHIKSVFDTKLDPLQFKQTATYKPDKKNIPVLRFIDRMKKAKALNPNVTFELPEPGDKFDYVVVKKQQTWNARGKKIEIKKGDQMEFLSVFNPTDYELDMEYYITGEFIGLFTRYMTIMPEFHDVGECLDRDTAIVKRTKDYLTAKCEEYTGNMRSTHRQAGLDYRRIYKSVERHTKQNLIACGSHYNLFYEDSSYIDYTVKHFDADTMVAAMLKEVTIYKLYALIGTTMRSTVTNLGNRSEKLKSWLYDNLDRLKDLIYARNVKIDESILLHRHASEEMIVEDINDLTPDDDVFIREYNEKRQLYKIVNDLKQETMQIMFKIKELRATEQTVVINAKQEAVIDARVSNSIPDYNWQ